MNRQTHQTKYPHLQVRPQWVRPTRLTAIRNFFAYQSALIRGDKDVVLHNRRYLPPEHEAKVRVSYETDKPQYESQRRIFGGAHGVEKTEDFQRPMNLDDFIPQDEWDGFDLKWIKTIGEGGFGMATLWEVTFEDGSRRKIVIKLPITENGDFKEELAWHVRYRGASHIVQAIDLQTIANCIKYGHNPKDQEEVFDQVDLGVLVLEFAEHGSFFHMMNKASNFGIKFSNKVLWEIWECLVKGVVSVAYQPDMNHHENLDTLLNSLDDPTKEDRLGWLDVYKISHDVHFDLEEQNILVSEDPKHSHHPICKLHDFGTFSRKMPECWATWNEERYWAARKCPKSNRIPPETIVKDWDYINLTDPENVTRFQGDNFAVGNPVAGRYGSWTNVFLIAKMESVITHSWYSHPMKTAHYRTIDGTLAGATYGWRLVSNEYSRVDPELRDQIIQCQFERPQDRPSLISLLRAILRRKRKGFNETDEQTRTFWDTFWQHPTGAGGGGGAGGGPGGGPGGNPGGDPGAGPAPHQPKKESDDSSDSSSSDDDEDKDMDHTAGSAVSFNKKGKGVAHPSRPPRIAALGNPVVTHLASLREKNKEKGKSRESANHLRVPGAVPNIIDQSIPSSFGRKTTWKPIDPERRAAPRHKSASPLIALGRRSSARPGPATQGGPQTPQRAQKQQQQKSQTSSGKRRAENHDLLGQTSRKIAKNDEHVPKGIQEMMDRAAELEKIVTGDPMDLDP